jgi:epoxyqueuosine reductase
MLAKAVKQIALDCGFELAGIARANPAPDFERYRNWADAGMAGAMSYLTDRRADRRADPATLLPSVRSILCVGKLYNGPEPYSNQFNRQELGWISRYAWGQDYHAVLRAGIDQIVAKMSEKTSFLHKICIDTAPLLERSYARLAGLGWIGKNTCLIHQGMGSWFFLGELLLSLDLEPDTPAQPLLSCRQARGGLWIPGFVSHTTPLSYEALCRVKHEREWATMSSAAISARTSAPGIGRPRLRGIRP